ncbi:hypothetical protein D3C85_182320 [compost metagenome]
MARLHAARGAVLHQLLRDQQGFLAELGGQDAAVAASRAGVRRRRLTRLVLAGQHAARDRAVGHHAQAVMLAGGQDLDFRPTVQHVVVRLAHDRLRHAHFFAQPQHFGDAPATEVRQAEAAQLARADQVAQRPQRLFQVFFVIVAVQVQDVHEIRAQARQALLDATYQPLARVMRQVRTLADSVADLAGQHPVVALSFQQLAHNLFRTALVVDVRGIDEIQAMVARRRDNARGLVVGRLFSEHHGAQA